MKTLLAIFSFISLLVLNTTCCSAYNRVNSYQDLLMKINNQNDSVETFEKKFQSMNKIERIPIKNNTSINNLNSGGYYIKITNRSWKESQNEVLLESGYIFEI